MPHIWNSILVVTKDELVPNWYIESALKVTIHRYKDKSYGIKRVIKGGNGRQMLVAFDSLDQTIQNGLGAPP